MSEAQGRTSPQSVGEILKRRREENGLSISQVAERMRLDSRVIGALEQNDYSSLPAALYVRGYLRGYARLLNIDPEAIIARFNNDSPSEPPEIIPEVRHPTQSSSSDKPVKAITYLVTFTMVILIIAWWQSNFIVRHSDPGVDAGEIPIAESPPPGLPYSFPIIKHPDSPFYRAPDDESDAAGNIGLRPDDAQAPGGKLIERGPAGPDRILIRLSADSWIEIFDAGGEKVYLSLARSGDVLSLSGTAPFSVLLGFAQGVSLELNGKPFDPAPYSRSGIARFTLGE